ncbi:response regulator [Hymenobacter sp. BT175]|uniref:response regulator n=1 Tax=Hymenobacter translucens TaxID=2886507 RepID=UPI001D0F3F0D|nr:response regulator [Hymenobacter translucens]MCC2547269.1 response regulator [Hymenobacter translucens]
MQKLGCTLLVDDDQTTNFLNQLLLRNLAVTDKLLVARNGQEALDMLQDSSKQGECPQLILLDVNMPVMNGFEFLEAYEQLSLPQRQSVVIIMLTTSLHPRDVQRVQEASIAGYLSKPLTKEKVNDILKTHFQRELP